MKIDIEGCYETSIGITLVIGTPIKFIPRIGMKISNDNYDFWEIKSISFNQNFINPWGGKMEGEIYIPRVRSGISIAKCQIKRNKKLVRIFYEEHLEND